MIDSLPDLLEMGSRAFDRGDFHRAAGYYQQAAGLAHQASDVQAELRGWDGAARSWANAGEIQKSIEAATRLLARAREADNKSQQMNAARLLASRMAHLDLRNRWHEIRPILLEGLETARRTQNNWEEVHHLRRLGGFAWRAGEEDRGLAWLQEALSALRPDTDGEAFFRYAINQSLSGLMRRRGEHAEAIRYAQIALGAAQEDGNPSFVADAQLTLARAERARGELVEALRLVEEVLPQAQQMGWKDTEREAEYLRGELLREMGHPEKAEPAARRALELAQEMKLKEEEVEYLLSLGQALLALGRCDEAREALTQARRLSEEEVEYLLSLGQALLALGRCDEAREALTQARRLSQERDYADHFQKAEELLVLVPLRKPC